MRNRTLALRDQGFGAATIYFLVWCLLAPAPVRATTVSPVDEYRNLITAGQSIQPLGTHPFGESINLYNGSLSFEVTDVSVPGTGAGTAIGPVIRHGHQRSACQPQP